MNLQRALLIAGLVVGPLARQGQAQSHHHPVNHPLPPVAGFVVVGSGWAGIPNAYPPGYFPVVPGAPSVIGGPGSLAVGGVPLGSPGPGGLMLPRMIRRGQSAGPASAPAKIDASLARERSGRSDELVEIGDRSFRGGNYHRAEERYQQALRTQGDSPAPHTRLAQIALVRGEYRKAAAHLRDAVTSSPSSNWLLEHRDIQGIFAEPSDFARQVAHLESYLQAHPQDRDAWFVLGAEHHLSGRYQQASDALTRLTDRPADPPLAAILDAATIARRAESSHETAATAAR